MKQLLTILVCLFCTLSVGAQNMVDLGLSSRTQWADRNLGATTEKGIGSLYQWGETSPQTNFSTVDMYEDYKFYSNVTRTRDDGEYVYHYTVTKYTEAGATLDLSDDAANVAWGSAWCMPTKAQWQELIDECTWTPNNDAENTYTVTGPNGNTIVISFNGYRDSDGEAVPGLTTYWTNELATQNMASSASIFSYLRNTGDQLRPSGCPIRPVAVAKAPVQNENFTLTNDGATITIAPGASLSEVKTALGDQISAITELYITGNYTTAASVNSLKTSYFPNLAKVHLTLETTATSIVARAYMDCTLLTSITIPESVTSIGGSAFSGCSGLTSITIPESVTSIWISAFSNCSGLTSINIPESVTSIEQYAFSGCSGLTSITFPEASELGSIGYKAFYNCSGLTSITIPEAVTSIGGYAFEGCSGLTSFTIPESVTSIGDYAFSGCSSLTSITIPESVTSIGKGAFSGCSSLESMTLPFVGGSKTATAASSSTLFGYIFGFSSYTGAYSVIQFYGLDYRTYYIPGSLKKLTITGGNLLYGAFENCTSLKSVVIGSKVTSIGEKAFSGCSQLTDITIGEGVNSISSNSFANCNAIATINIKNVLSWCNVSGLNNLTDKGVGSKTLLVDGVECTDLVIPDGIISIPSSAFKKMNIKTVSIPNSVTTIGSSAFQGCSGLTSVSLPNSVTSIGNSAFQGCSGLEIISIPNSVTNIGNSVFQNCTGLSTITIPESVTTIGTSVFSGCNNLIEATVESTVTGVSTFKDLTSLKSVVLGSKVTDVESEAFSGCSQLTDITFGEGVTSISSNSFANCNAIATINIKNVLSWCNVSGLNNLTDKGVGSKTLLLDGVECTDLVIPDGTTSIPSSAFKNFVNIKTVNIANSVTEIGSSAFTGCSGITELTIPESVTAIGTNGINTGSENLKYVTMLSMIPPVLADKNTVHSFPTILVPAESLDAYAEATNWSDHRGQFFPIGLKIEWTITATAADNMSSIHALIGEDNLDNVVSLKVKGTINSYDIMIMRNKMTHLKYVDLGEASIVANNYEYYTGYHSENDVLDQYAFRTDLSSIVLPATLKTIGNGVFSGSNIKEVTIPKTVTKIGDNAFKDCKSLKTVNLEQGANIAKVGANCFSGSSLTNFNMGDAIIQEIGSYAFSDCLLSGDITLNVGNIGSYAFNKCKSIESVELPYTTKVGTYAFYFCSMKQFSAPVLKTIGSYAFMNCASATLFDMPSAVNIGEYAFGYCESLKSISIPVTTILIDNYAFYKSGLEKIIIEDSSSTLQIGYGEYKNCTSSLYNTNYKTTIYQNLFCNTSIKEFYIGRPLTGKVSFNVDAKLEDLNGVHWKYTAGPIISSTVPFTVEYGEFVDNIGYFYNTKIKSLTVKNNSVKSLAAKSFYGCTELVSINSIALENVETIGAEAFYNCNKLVDVSLGNKVITIGDRAFYNCAKIREIEIPASLSNIGVNVFYGCSSLASCTIPKNSVLTEIPTYTFYGCKALEKMQLPVSVKKIGDYAFQNCSNMTEMKIPSSITSIGANAFAGCTKLNDVYTYTLEPQNINQNTFATYSTATLHVPTVSWYNYYYDTQWSQFLKLSNFDEPYDYVLIQKDYTLRTETSGIISGKPETEIEATGGLIVTGNVEQPLGDVHVKFDVTTNKGASIIAQNNLTADNLYVDIDVKKDYWHFFCFPFDVDLTKIQKAGSYIFRRYDSSMRASNGTGGWRDVEGTTLAAGKGYIFRTNTAGTLSIPVANPDLSGAEKTTVLVKYGDDSTPDEHKNWNFVGNTFLSYYDTNSMSYDAPIVVWDGTTYVAYRPGDDDYKLTPYQAFFVQRPNNVADVTFSPDGRMTGITVEAGGSSNARMRKAARLHSDRQIVNVTISDGANVDKCRVVFNDNQSLDYEMECDAAKFLSSENVPQIYTIDDNGTQYAINERPMFNGVVSLGFVAPHDGEYTFAASRMDVPVYVIDNMTGETFNLADGYTFTAEAGTDNTRFAITAKPEADVDGIKTINADAINSGKAVIYDLSGKRVTKAVKGVYVVEGAKVYVK